MVSRTGLEPVTFGSFDQDICCFKNLVQARISFRLLKLLKFDFLVSQRFFFSYHKSEDVWSHNPKLRWEFQLPGNFRGYYSRIREK